MVIYLLEDATRTLWLLEDSLVNTRLESSVEERIVHGSLGGDLVVVLDILLEGNAAADVLVQAPKQLTRRDSSSREDRGIRVGKLRTLIHCAERKMLVNAGMGWEWTRLTSFKLRIASVIMSAKAR